MLVISVRRRRFFDFARTYQIYYIYIGKISDVIEKQTMDLEKKHCLYNVQGNSFVAVLTYSNTSSPVTMKSLHPFLSHYR